MKALKAFIALTALLLVFTGAEAQRLLIEYDYLKDEFKYFKIKNNGTIKELSQAVVGYNKDIRVEVKNFNPFIHGATANFNSSVVDEGSNVNFFALLSPITGGLNAEAFLGKLESEQVGRGDDKGGITDEGLLGNYNSAVEAYNNLYDAENEIGELEYVIKKLNDLKYNSFLPADSIKKYTTQIVEDFLQRKAPFGSTAFMSKAESLSERIRQYSNTANNESMKFLSRSATDSGGGNYSNYNKTMADVGQQASKFSSNYSTAGILDEYGKLESLYQSIINTSFQFNSGDMARDDEVDVLLNFYDISNVAESGESSGVDLSNQPMVKTKDLRVVVKGDMKINSSIGLAFPGYGDNYSFINKDSLVTQVDGDNFVPNLAAFVNFYPYSGRLVNFGGSFGVGVPITGGSRDLNFMLGLSSILGNKNRVVISGGAALGQVDKLADGVEVGDNLGSLTEGVSTRKGYDWGYFLGLSFTIPGTNSN